MIQYISIRQIMDDVLAHPLLQDLTLERAVNYAQEFMRIVGMPQLFTDKIATLEIKDYRVPLPCDFYEMIQVTDGKGKPYRYTTDTFHLKHIEDNGDQELAYKLQNNVLFSNHKEGIINISYRAIDVDEDGFPLIPDNGSFVKALELYIKKQAFNVLLDLGKITATSWEAVRTEYAWYVGQAQSDLVRPTIDQMQSITNMWNQLLVRNKEHRTSFKYEGSKEQIRIH